MVCGDKDDDGDNDVAHRAKRQKLVEENVGGGGGSGVTTILSQDMAMLKLEHLLALYEVNCILSKLIVCFLARWGKVKVLLRINVDTVCKL
jgi:hypothetical protein